MTKESQIQQDYMKYVYDLHSTMLDKKLMLIYEGVFSQKITTSLLTMTERKIQLAGEEPEILRKVFNIMVECLQNISKHAAIPDDVAKNETSIFTIGKDNNWYYISTGNLIANNKLGPLKAKLNQINDMNYEELKELYREALANSRIDETADTGLGLIDIAKKSREKLLFDFVSIDDDFTFYSFQIKLKRKNKNITQEHHGR